MKRSRGIFVAVALLCGLFFAAQASASPANVAAKKAAVEKGSYGKLADGTEIEQYTLRNKNGAYAEVITYGAILTQLWMPDRSGKLGDVVLGLKDLHDYAETHTFLGATVGRYANRIAGGHFTLDGKEYTLAKNNGPNTLHGGNVGFNQKVWTAALVPGGKAAVRLTYVSKDGEENFPGTLTTSVTYTLTDDNALKIDYNAKTDKDTVVNLTNHSYFNLAGGGTVLDYTLYLNAAQYTPVDDTLIPTGKILSVKGTPLDFTKPEKVGARIDQFGKIGGYDHNFVVNGKPGTLRVAARVTDPSSGRQMSVLTTQPGVQIYTANGFNGSITGANGVVFVKHGAICLETQHYPDTPNHPNFPSTILHPGQTFHSETVYRFTAVK
jgi:aldose 1-epimerase